MSTCHMKPVCSMPSFSTFPHIRGCLIVLVCLAALAGCGGGGGGGGSGAAAPSGNAAPAPAPTPAPAPDPGTDRAAQDLESSLSGLDFQSLLEVSVAAISLRDPEEVVAAGLADTFGLQGATLTDISFAYQNVTLDMWQVVRNYLDRVDIQALTADEQLSYEIYSWQVDQALAMRPFLHYDYQATYFLTGVPPETERFFSDLHPLESRADALDYLTRLALVDEKIRQLIANLKVMEGQGVIEPAATMGIAIDVHRGVMNSAISSNPYYSRFSNRLAAIPGISASEITELRSRARTIVENQISPAYSALVDFMVEQLGRAPAAIGVGQFPAGEAYYRERLRYHTTTSMSPEQIHELGLREVARVQTELREKFGLLGYPRGETLARSFGRVATDGGSTRSSNAVDVFVALIDDAEIRMQALFNRLPEAEVVVRGDNYGGFYIGPSLDGSRPGTFYASTSANQPTYLMPTLAYHEAMPGHHMQIALAQESELPLFRRIAIFNGYVEGWGLYAERLAYDSGWYASDPYGDLGRLYFENLRAVRLVVDTGIHYYGWSFDRAVTYFQDNVGSSRGAAESNIARYSIYTGQATAYMVGMLKLLELRDRVQAALGDGFTMAGFHTLVLEEGPMPLDILERRVDSEITGAAAWSLRQ